MFVIITVILLFVKTVDCCALNNKKQPKVRLRAIISSEFDYFIFSTRDESFRKFLEKFHSTKFIGNLLLTCYYCVHMFLTFMLMRNHFRKHRYLKNCEQKSSTVIGPKEAEEVKKVNV